LNLQTSSTHEKAALAYDDTNQLIYACQYSQACRSEVYSDKTAFHFTTDKINRWEYRKTRHLPAYARLTLIDTAEAWRGFGASGAAQSVQPLAELRVSRGYRTSAGEETETTPRLYILSAEYTAHQGRGQLIITATDAFGLLDLFRPQRPAIYSAQTLAYIAAAIAARAGIQIETDSAAAWSTSIAEFTWLPTTSALYALTQVLNLGGGIARVESSGKIKLYDFAAYAPASKPTIGASSEIRSARWGSATPEGNAHFTAGAEHSYRAQDLADTMSLGLTLERATHDTRLPSAASCQQAANAALRTLSGYAARGWAVIPLRPDLETWDMVRIQTDTAILPLNTERVLTTLTEWYNREDLTCQSALELTGD